MRVRLPHVKESTVLAAVLVTVAVVAVAVRVPGALSLPFWQDEVASARVIAEPTLDHVVGEVRRTESTPPLWYAIAWAGHQAGISLEALRMLSVAFAAALAVLVVLYARRLMPLWPAAVAGLLTGIGWQFVAHGRELRAYALYALLALLFARLLTAAARAPTGWRLAGLGTCVALGLLTHYFFALTLAAGLLWLWTGSAPRRARVGGTLASVVGVLPLLGFLPVLSEQYAAQRFSWISDFDPLKAAYLFGTLFDWGGTLYALGPAPFGARQALWLLVLAAVIAGAVVLWRRSEEGRLCGLLALGPFVIATGAWLAGPNIFNTRNLLGVAPFAAVALAGGLSALPRSAALAASTATLALVAVGTAQGPPLGPPADRVAQALVAEGWEDGDRIILFGDFYGFRSPIGWYLPGRPFLQVTAAEESQGGVFVIAQGSETWTTLLDYYALDPLSLRQVEDIYVARLPSDERLVGELAAVGGYVLAPPGSPTA